MHLADRIAGHVTPETAALVRIYFDPTQSFAGETFDGLPDNVPNRFTPSDIVAASLLDVRFEPRAVRSLLYGDSAEAFSNRLKALPARTPLWQASETVLEAATALYSAVQTLPGVGRTRTSKLLSRKRPHLVPVMDSVIHRALGLGLGGETWQELREVLQVPGLAEQIETLRPDGLGTRVSTLRLLDVAVWMQHSQSRNAVKARRQVAAQRH